MRCDPDYPAFHEPSVVYALNLCEPGKPRETTKIVEEKGLTKREYFAVHILEGMLSDPNWMLTPDLERSAISAVRTADLLIKALNQAD